MHEATLAGVGPAESYVASIDVSASEVAAVAGTGHVGLTQRRFAEQPANADEVSGGASESSCSG